MKNTDEIYLLGAGGMGMAPLAKYLSIKGYRVFGWDDYVSEERRKTLKEIIWTDKIPATCSICVRSTAINDSHSIFQKALKQCRCYLRGEFLAELLRDTKLCVVCGSHGKSTTTAYLIHFFKSYRIPVNYLLGAEFQKNYYFTASFEKGAEWTLFELDESDGTIDLFSPEVSVVLNTDWDHPLFYKTALDYRNAFESLAKRTKGFVITNEIWDSSIDCRSIDEGHCGLDQNEAFARKTFELLTQKRVEDKIVKAFPGIKRRQELLLKTKRLTVLLDYAHHPGELRALFEHFKADRNFYFVFEPHRASRLHQFFDDFIEVLKPVKHLYLCPIYGAFETDNVVCRQLNDALPQALSLESLKTEDFIQNEQPVTIIFAGAGRIESLAKDWVSTWEQRFRACFEKEAIDVQLHYALKTSSLMRTGGSTFCYCRPKDLNQMKSILTICKKVGLDIFVIGSGSNLLIPDEEYKGIVIKLEERYWRFCKKINDYIYEVGAGMILNQLLDLMQADGVGGFEFLDGIPGTLGGALSMNAGTKNIGILDCVLSLQWMDFSGEVRTLKRQDLDYGYRCCGTLKNGIILSAVLQGKPSSMEIIKKERNYLRQRRQASQPLGASLGCFFKNSTLGSTGQLLDRLGLKNTHFGQIYVSPIHANFIMNQGNGTYNDVINLVLFIQNVVKEKTGIILEPEVRVLGKAWEEVL